MKAGTYYIGDLCYVLSRADWEELGERECFDGEFTLSDGRSIALYSTAQGDGGYDTNIGGECCVDSGSIGCVLVSDMTRHEYDNIEDLAVFHTFESDFDTSVYKELKYDEEYDFHYDTKVIRFGEVEVYT